jgi:hypothetical protein
VESDLWVPVEQLTRAARVSWDQEPRTPASRVSRN